MKRTALLLVAVLSVACSKKAENNSSNDLSETPPTGDLASFSDVDGLIVRPIGYEIEVLNPRTGELSPRYDWANSAGLYPSPDGIHFVASSADKADMIVARLGMDGTVPKAEIVHRIPGLGQWGQWVDPSGTWAYNERAAVNIATGEVFDCDGRTEFVRPLPDGRHLLLSCGLYEDGELIAPGTNVDFQSRVGEGVQVGTVSGDGAWLFNPGFSESPPWLFHVPSRTAVQSPDYFLGVVTAGVDYYGLDPAGRLMAAPSGVVGSLCEDRDVTPNSQGLLVDAIGLVMGDADFPRRPLELGSSGAFFERQGNEAVKITFLGLSADGQHALYAGGVVDVEFAIEDTIGGERRCYETPVEARLRRVPVAGGAALDVVGAPGFALDCAELPLQRRYPWEPAPYALAGPGNSTICLASSGLVVTDDDIVGLPWAGGIASPGNRASISSRVMGKGHEAGVCLQKLEPPYDTACFADPRGADGATEPSFWGGWAVPGATGLGGTAIYRTSNYGAEAGGRVHIFGAAFGSSGELAIGDFTVPGTAIVSWTDTHITFDMPADAPIEPAIVRVNGQNNGVPKTLYREATFTPNLDIPERITASYGTVFVPSSTASLDGLLLGWSDVNSLQSISPARVVNGGFEFDLGADVLPGEYWMSVELGNEQRYMLVEVDGSTSMIGDSWTRIERQMQSFPRYSQPFIEAADGIVLSTGQLLAKDGSLLELTDPAILGGAWTRGPFDPYVLRDDGTIEQLTGFDIQDTASAVFATIGGISSALAAARMDQPYGDNGFVVSESVGRGLLFTTTPSGACGTGTCRADYGFDLATGEGTLLAEQMTFLSGINYTATTSAGIHVFNSTQLETFSPDAADFGTRRPSEMLDHAGYLLDGFATEWGGIGREQSLESVYVGLRSDGATGYVDIGLTGVLALGVSSDGSRAVIGTDTGVVYLVTAADPTTPTPIGAVPDLDNMSEHIAITNDGFIAWFSLSNRSVYLRQLPQ